MRPGGVKRQGAFQGKGSAVAVTPRFMRVYRLRPRAVPESQEPIIRKKVVHSKRGVVSARSIRFCLFSVSTLPLGALLGGGQTSVECRPCRPCRPCEGPVDTPLPRTLALIQWAQSDETWAGLSQRTLRPFDPRACPRTCFLLFFSAGQCFTPRQGTLSLCSHQAVAVDLFIEKTTGGVWETNSPGLHLPPNAACSHPGPLLMKAPQRPISIPCRLESPHQATTTSPPDCPTSSTCVFLALEGPTFLQRHWSCATVEQLPSTPGHRTHKLATDLSRT